MSETGSFSFLWLVLGWLGIFGGWIMVTMGTWGLRYPSGKIFWMGIIPPAILATMVIGFFVWVNSQMNSTDIE